MQLDPLTSQKIRFYSFIAMVLLVFVHAYNLNQRYMQPMTVVDEPMTINAFLQYFLSNGIFRFRIPLLFAISGFLFAMHDAKPHGERMKKRTKTLLLPYLLWSAIGLLLTFVFEQFEVTKAVVLSANLGGDSSLVGDYNWQDFMFRWLLNPVSFQLWFIRVLLFYNLIYLGLRWMTLKLPYVWFPFVVLVWIAGIGLGFAEGEGLLFFTLGIWMQKRGFDIVSPKKWLSPLPWAVAFVVLTGIKTWLAFNGMALMGNATYTVLTLMHKVVILSGLVSVWYGCDAVVRWCMGKAWFVWASAFSFIIYALHVPLTSYAIDIMLPMMQQLEHARLLTFILLPTGIVVLCIGVGAVMRTLLPGVYGILTGGRGTIRANPQQLKC